jgi:DNA-binding MarR family transcriptional regulator
MKRERLIADVGAELGALLASARAVTNEAAAVFVEGRAIRPATFHIARWLHSVGPARPTEIALALDMDKAAVSRLVADLVREGLVEKRRHLDARSVAVALTRPGMRRVTRALESKGTALTKRLAAFADDELATLAGLLQRLRGS